MADPQSPLVTAIVARWVSLQGTTLLGLSGPYFGEVSTDKAGTLPRCVFTVRSRLEHETSTSQTWLHDVRFDVYAETPELVAPETTKVAAVYDPDSLITGGSPMTLSEGAVNSIRAREVRYVKDDKTLWHAELPYQFRTTRPRV